MRAAHSTFLRISALGMPLEARSGNEMFFSTVMCG